MSVRTRGLSRRQRRMLNNDSATLAEEIATDEYGIKHRPKEEDWYDGRHPETGSKTEVKSCLSSVGKNDRTGRFRLWDGQLQSLNAADANGTAWVAFVLFHLADREVRIRRMKPSTVAGMVRERGGYNRAGHSGKGRQHKLPWPHIFPG